MRTSSSEGVAPGAAPAAPALFVVLASRSPQRAAILRQLEVPFRVAPSRHDESLVAGDLVLGVDTVVVLDRRVLGKAATSAAAVAFVGALSGRRHEVVSGVCLLGPGGRVWTGHARTTVTFRALAAEAVATYVATGEWRERAGAYAIQGVGSALVSAVAGDYWNVVGLPVALLLDGLDQFGVTPFSWLCGAAPRAGR